MTRRVWPLIAAAAAALSVQTLAAVGARDERLAVASRPAVRVAVNTAPPGTPNEAVARLYLRQLDDRARVPLAAGPYLRGAFGPGWSDSDGDGCSTRDDVLRRWTSSGAQAGSCEVVGSIVDPYTGRLLPVSAVEPVPVVPLAEAWVAGAWRWTAAERAAFANDSMNLVPTSRWLVRSEVDGHGWRWRPPNEWYWCTHASTYVGTKYLYNLSVTPEERARLAVELNSCAGPWDTNGP